MVGALKDIIHFKFYRSASGGQLAPHASHPKPIFPIFHNSNIPIGAKPQLEPEYGSKSTLCQDTDARFS